MYKCKSFAKLLTWHKDGVNLYGMIWSVPNCMIWKHIDEKWLEFVSDVCNIRLRLALDEVNPFRHFSSCHSCRNPNLVLKTKARACKGEGQEGSLGVTSHVLESARECEGMNPHTSKWAPTLGVGVPMDSWFSKRNYRGQNPLYLGFPYIIKNILERRCLKWVHMTHLDT
jgi:hypothetical protein